MSIKGTKGLLIILGVLVLLIIILSGIYFMIKPHEVNDDNKTSMPSAKKSIDIAARIDEVKKENSELELVYESSNINEIVSLVYKETENYKSIIIDTATGDVLTFLDLIKDDKLDEFKEVENKLLEEKYPEFIVNGINNSGGERFYFVKENEVVIYYNNFTYDYPFKEVVSLKINYNEVKDLIKFSPNLDKEYKNEDGFLVNVATKGDTLNNTREKKVVALTFDDGPSKKYNALILEELNRNKARATFFMVGQMMNSCQKCVLDTYKSGNEVASHTYEHINIKKNDALKVEESLNKVNALYNEITGDTIKLLRPPYGAYNKTNLANINLPFILWDLDTEDWRYKNVDHIVDYIMNNVRDGSIILMHELYETSYEALKIVLPKLYAEGYQVVTVSDLALTKGVVLEPNHAYRSLN